IPARRWQQGLLHGVSARYQKTYVAVSGRPRSVNLYPDTKQIKVNTVCDGSKSALKILPIKVKNYRSACACDLTRTIFLRDIPSSPGVPVSRYWIKIRRSIAVQDD